MNNVTSHSIAIVADHDDTEFNVFKHPIATQPWGSDTTVSYFFMSAREAAPYLVTYRFNRKIDVRHKNEIKQDLIKNHNPHLMGTIQIIRDKRNNCRIINGQHRVAAILEIIEEDIDMKFNISLMFEVYDINADNVNDYADHNSVEHLFKIANKSLALPPEDEDDKHYKQLMFAISKDKLLSGGIVDKPSGTVRRPRILAKELYEKFKERLPVTVFRDTKTDDIIRRIKEVNVRLSLMTNQELFGRSNPAEAKLRQLDKARELGFFLNLECKYPPATWIPLITTK